MSGNDTESRVKGSKAVVGAGEPGTGEDKDGGLDGKLGK